jgi:hypothetical protein
MTLPDERRRAVAWARKFLQSLLWPKETPRVPLEMRRQARAILKHFPTDLDIQRAADKAPDLFDPDSES